ncbi:chromosome-associated kinesin KIF4-like [Amphiura filiformis]|uniref:chromosome-associated kinesin KIF4-like n=1 Tax=Amphiura filiformis TaxID=82378 RepID=UPI003B20CA52
MMPEEDGKDIPVRVALRCRPLITKEIAEGCQQCFSFNPTEPQVILGKDKAFTYDYVFDANTRQEVVYSKAVQCLVDGIFKGLNATVLAYGQTGSGKTFSMGNIYNLNDAEVKGIIPRVIERLFNGIQDRTDTEFLVKVSYLEIYNEEINDLLGSAASKGDSLAIREQLDGGIRVSGLSEVQVQSSEETMRCLERGAVGRTTASTAMNATSSRSHAIFTIHIDMVKKDDSNSSCHAKFHLVDLAGSERAKKTKAQGDRFKEGVNINRGLLALGNVISALGDENGRKGHIPYRDAKLTRLLQDSLGGNSQTLMIACVSPADSNMEETLNTLRYADRARRIKNKPVVNRDPQAAELAKLKQQVQQLQIQLLQNQAINGGSSVCDIGTLQGSADLKTLLDRNQRLESENQKLNVELNTALGQTTHMCEKAILAEMSRDKLKQKLEELRSHADLSISALNVSLDNTQQNGEQVPDKLNILKNLQQKIIDMQAEEKKGMKQEELYGEMNVQSPINKMVSENQEGTTPTPSADSPSAMSSHTLRQAQLGRELQELNKALALKQELAEKMSNNDDQMAVIKIQYESNVNQLQSDINTLQKEKEDLMGALNAAKTNTSGNKVSEQRRKRLKELEEQIIQLKKKMNEQGKMLKLKEKSDQRVNTLNSDIKAMKQTRVRLMKQMKEDASKWQQWKTQKNKEVMQLKAKERKRQCEVSKMERQHQKQQMVMKRKMEEASAANKRLKEALLKQKSVSGKKEEQSQTNGIGKRIRSWLDHEIEIVFSIREAKHHLASLLTDRKVISQELVNLEQKQKEEPPSKKMATPERSIHIGDHKMNKRIYELKQELELRNVQIADLQQEIVDADQEDKHKSRWSKLTTMMEAKCGLQFLLEQTVSAKLETSTCRGELQEVQTGLGDALKEIDEVKEERMEVEKECEEKVTSMQRTYEDKILYLLSQLPKAAAKDAKSSTPNTQDLSTRLHFQEQVISDLKNVHEQLQETVTENEDLKKQLTLASYSSGSYSTGKKMALLPRIVSPETSPDYSKPKKKPVTKKKSVAITDERYTLDEFFSEESDIEEGDDSDWQMTPVQKRQRRERRLIVRKAPKGCGCKSKCKGMCGCRKNKKTCTDNCKCDPELCGSRGDTSTIEDTSSRSIDSTTSNLLNTTVTIEHSDSSPIGTPVLFKSPISPPKRKALIEVNQERPRFKKKGLSTTVATKKDMPQKHVAKNPLLQKAKSSTVGGVANQGIANRKRKLLSLSHSTSFFKPLSDS